MRAGSTPAVVLRAREFGESDKIVTVLSRTEGKFTGIAKGAKRSRRRFPGSLELFSHVNLAFKQKNDAALCFLERAVLIQPWLNLVTSLERYTAASHVIEMADKMTADREVGDEIYALVVAALARLDARPPTPTTLRVFELAALAASGYRQEFSRCTRCQEELARLGSALRVPYSGTGLLCARCSDREHGGPTISAEAAATLLRLEAAVARALPDARHEMDASTAFVDDDEIDAATSPRVASEIRIATLTLLQPHIRGRLRVLESMGVF